VDFEGPVIVIYTKNLEEFAHNNDLVRQLAQSLRRRVAIRSLHAAMRRDSASGDGYSVATITKDGFTALDEKEIQKRLAKMKLT